VHERLKLNGWFALDNAPLCQREDSGAHRGSELARQGKPNELRTSIRPRFSRECKATSSWRPGWSRCGFDYTVPGATIQLKGTYTLEGGAMDFTGSAKMDAPVSKMVGGWKGVLLKPPTASSKRRAGTEVSIRIEGTREAKFTIDFDHMKVSEGR